MHRIQTTIRRIAPADLPSITPIDEPTRDMNEQELANIGIVPLGNDFYSCIHQEERDPETLEWRPKEGQALPGDVVSAGVLVERHAKLPAEVRPKILRAQIIRSKTASAKEVVDTNLAEVGAVLSEHVGAVNGAPLVDTTSSEATLTEAQRLVAVRDSDLERELVPMADVMDGDILEAESLVPHSWAGEPKR